MMNRRELFRLSTALSLMAALPGVGNAHSDATIKHTSLPDNPLTPPPEGSINVAFLLSDGSVVIDFAGPWEVFDCVNVPERGFAPVFHLYTVSETAAPIQTTGGMTIVPNYTFETAPPAQVIVIPAQNGANEAALAWIVRASQTADLTMSVCTGAFVLAKTGLLAGKSATTYHGAFGEFAMQFPDIALKRGSRFVESGKFATSGGLSSGIDLALRVVERYFGRSVAMHTAYTLEYQGEGWMNADSNQVYAKRRISTDSHPLCPVCDMDVNKATASVSVYKGKTYYFCMASHKNIFDAHPGRFLA